MPPKDTFLKQEHGEKYTYKAGPSLDQLFDALLQGPLYLADVSKHLI